MLTQEIADKLLNGKDPLEKERLKANQELLLDGIVKVNAQTFDSAKSYNNVVLTLGYAGFFALLGFVREQIRSVDTLFLVFIMSVSVFIFVTWTVLNSIRMSHEMQSYSKILSAESVSAAEILKRYDEQKLKDQKTLLAYNKRWYLVFISSFLSAFIGGVVLLIVVIGNMIWDEFSFMDWLF